MSGQKASAHFHGLGGRFFVAEQHLAQCRPCLLLLGFHGVQQCCGVGDKGSTNDWTNMY